MKDQELKILHISHADRQGGAAIAASRIHKALLSTGKDSHMWVNRKTSGTRNTECFNGHIKAHLQDTKRLVSGGIVSRIFKSENKIVHSPQVFNSTWPERINSSSADIVNLHWVCNEMLSVRDISKIRKPIIWSFHDMWPLCGAEHYTEDHRWREGYSAHNRPSWESGFDLNKFTWKRKKRHWKKAGGVVAPSVWLSNITKNSILFKNWDVTTIQYPIDVNFWKPIDKENCRAQLDLPKHLPLIMIGNEGGVGNKRKGFDLFIKAIKKLKAINENFGIVMVGQSTKIPELDEVAKCFYFEYFRDFITLRMAYSAADVFALPSKMDALCMTVMEAQACNTPTVVFQTSGQQDLIVDNDSGYAAPAFDVEKFAKSLNMLLQNHINLNPRKHIVLKNSQETVAASYLDFYSKVLENHKVDSSK